MQQPPARAERGRKGYLDWLRGVGVLIMIEAHTLDSWTRLGDRVRPAYKWALVLGGFGAPIFLFLAGVALALAYGSRRRRGMSEPEATRRSWRRGLEVFALAFLFRLQSLVISGGGLRAFLKVDILNVMGLAMVVTAALWWAGRTWRGRTFALVAATVLAAMLTPIVRETSILDVLPPVVDAYLRPEAGRSTFTIFPWAGFLFAGAVAGLWLDSGTREQEGHRNLALLAAGSAIGVSAYVASYLPPIYAHTSYWTSSPTFFFVRLGILLVLVPGAFAWSRASEGWWRGWSPLQDFGVSSLFVYWIHVEMVYGVLSAPIHRALSFEQVLVAMGLFAGLLFALVMAKKRLGSRSTRGSERGQRPGQKATVFAQLRARPAP